MNLRRIVTSTIAAAVLATPFINTEVASASVAGMDCDGITNRRHWQTVESGDLVFQSYYVSGADWVCWTAHDQFGRRGTFTTKVVKKNLSTGNTTTEWDEHAAVYGVGGRPDTANRRVTVDVWLDPRDGRNVVSWGKITLMVN